MNDKNNLHTMETIKIMIVDDEPIIRKAIRYELNESHAQIQCQLTDEGDVVTKEVEVLDTFANGPQLYAALNDTSRPRPDYLLVDMELQGEPTGGIAITQRVRQLYETSRHTPIGIIILSGRFDNLNEGGNDRRQRMEEIGQVVFEALHRGANAFVSKNAVGGFSIDNILHAISCLERGEQFYFNYPVMVTIKEAAEQYFASVIQSTAEYGDFSQRDRALLLWEAAGCTATEIAQRMSPLFTENEKSVQDLQKDLSTRLHIVNKSGARVAKAIMLGLLDPRRVSFLTRR